MENITQIGSEIQFPLNASYLIVQELSAAFGKK